MLDPKRVILIEKGAEVAAKTLYDLHQGRGDTSMVEVGGQMKMVPYLPMKLQELNTDKSGQTFIEGNENEGTIYLTLDEDETLKELVNQKIGQLVLQTVRTMSIT